MTDITPFDDRPDEALGARIRAALDRPGIEALVARVRGALVEADSPWDVLARWAPRGLVAAAAAAAVLWFLMPAPAPAPVQGPIASAPVQMEVSPGQAEAVVLTVALLEGR